MQVPVLIEPLRQDVFRARSGEPLSLSAEGTTPEEAVRKLQDLMSAHLSGGISLVALEVPESNPWLRGAGMFKDDPLFDEWQQAINERRRQMDADPDVP